MNKNNNLIPGFDSSDWKEWFPQKQLKPIFQKEISNDRLPLLKIAADGNDMCSGAWTCLVEGIEPKATYKFRTEYRFVNSGHMSEISCVSVILSWYGPGLELIRKNYADTKDLTPDGWAVLSGIFESPENCRTLKVELILRWPGSVGSVLWRNPLLTREPSLKHRLVRVATTYINPYKNPDKTIVGNMKRIMHVIDDAGKNKPDIICLSETINDRCVPIPLEEKAETIPGRTTEAIAAKARQYNCYIICSLHETDGINFYNTSVLIGRQGEIVGKYRKVHLATAEKESGIVPGSEYSVFSTDFGKIGILICWDQIFPEAARILRLRGAEIIFIPTAGDAIIQTRARALDNGVYIVVAGVNRLENNKYFPSRIIDPQGEIIDEVKSEDLGSCTVEIDLDKKMYRHWVSLGPCECDTRSIYIKERRPETYGIVGET